MRKKGLTEAKAGLLRSLKFKLILVSTGLILIAVISLAFFFIQRQVVQIKEQLINRGETITRLMAYNARYGVQIGDKPILDKIIGGVMDDPDVLYCIISDQRGGIITSYNQDSANLVVIKPAFSTQELHAIEYTNANGKGIINLAMPVVLAAAAEQKEEKSSALEEDFFSDDADLMAGSNAPEPAVSKDAGQNKRVIGAVQVGITLSNMKKEIAASIRKTVLYSALIFVVGFVLAFWIGSVISAPLKKVVTILNDMSEGEGDLSQRIHLKSNDEVGDLANGFNTFMDKFQEVKKISVFLNGLADGGGDLTKRLNIASQDEIGMLAKGFDRFTDKLHDIIKQVAANTEKISAASQSVSDTIIKLAREVDEVAHQSTEVADSTGKMSHSIELTSRNVSDVNELMNKTEVVSNSGVDVVHETKNGMGQIAETITASSDIVGRLNESSQKIGDTITIITEIADQTKLIAINAAIEASRVGAQGKGFAVVAEEIRRLAARVTKATQEISQRIRAIQDESLRVVEAMKKGRDEANRGLELSSRSEQSLENISTSVRDAKGRISQITVAANEQTSTIGIISRNISSISGSSKESSEGVSKTAQAMQELNREVQELRQLVGRFVINR